MMSSETTHNKIGGYFWIVTLMGVFTLIFYLLLTSPIGILAKPLEEHSAVMLYNSGGLVSINYATEAELTVLKGIGPAKATAIVEYRNKNGSFDSIEDIMLVNGIGEGMFGDIKDEITV